MNVILIDDTGFVVNVICADSVTRAQQFYPTYTCVQRAEGQNVGPGDITRDGGQTFETQDS